MRVTGPAADVRFRQAKDDAEDVLARARERAAAIMEDAARRAERFREEAERRAERLVAEAQAQADRVREEARAEGYREGEEQAAKELARQMEELLELAEGIRRAKDDYLRRCEPEIVELALDIARKIIVEELTVNDDAVLHIADRALSLAGATTQYQVRLHPADAERLYQYLERSARAADVEIVADPEVERGGCLIATPHGRVDAQLPTQLANVRAALLGNREDE